MNETFRIDPNDLLTTNTTTATSTPTTNTNINCAAYQGPLGEGGSPYILFMTDVDGNVDLDQNSIAYFTSIPISRAISIPFHKIYSPEFSYQLYKNPSDLTNIYISNINEERVSVTKREPGVEDEVNTLVRDNTYTTYKQFYDAAFFALG